MEINKLVIGDKIRKLRESKGWSQKEFGVKIGLKQSSITEIERGKKLASMDKIYKMLEVFNISFDFLFEDVLLAFKMDEKDSFYDKFKTKLNLMDFEDLEMINELICEFINYENLKIEQLRR